MLLPKRPLRPVVCCARTPASWRLGVVAGWLACAAAPGLAQTPAPLVLQPSTRLQIALPQKALDAVPMFVYGQTLSGTLDQRTLVEGDVELRRHDLTLKSDRLEHSANNVVHATGQVSIVQNGDRFVGPALELQLDTQRGHFEQPAFAFLRNGGSGHAERIDFVNKTTVIAHQVRYTTCSRSERDAWAPDWEVNAERIVFDQTDDVGTVTNGVLRFKGTPVLASPWASFPLSDKRKSGVLTPSYNIDNRSGLEVTVPYYLNLAPNRDATLYPTLMARRGLDLGAEFRYLEPSYAGQLRTSHMASDRLRNADRWAASLQHHHVHTGIAGSTPLNLRVDWNRVSDSNYWRDFPRGSTGLTERLLRRDAVLTTSAGAWSYSLGNYTWQTLQDTDDRITVPYDRVPSLAASYQPGPLRLAGQDGVRFSLYTEATTFRADRTPAVGGLNETTDVNGTRWVGQAQLEKTWQTPGWYVRPGVQMHARQYQLDYAVGPATQRSQRPSVAVPSASLDAGLVFDRAARLAGRDTVQTVEPRLYYSQTPFRQQGYLPVYDSAQFDFNAATIFNSNTFSGHDRVADLRAVTVGLTSRILSPDTGSEWANLSVAQRVRLNNQQVVLPGQETITERASDVLLGGNLSWQPQWSLNSSVQYNRKKKETVRSTVGGRYHPSNYRVVNLTYRMQRASSEQLDLGWQWPLRDILPGPRAPDLGAGQGLGPGHWYSVGRINYSLRERRSIDLVAGLEYDAGCWVARAVVERLQHSRTSASQRILLQIEFSGFASVGTNPLRTLSNHIPRYQMLRQQINPPSRFERYD